MSDKQTEALKLALEALNKCDAALAEELSAWDIDPPLHHVLEASNACGPAITAIREALAEQPAQQEPVAWANPNDLQNFDMKVRTNGGPLHTVPLYTSPQPSKPWAGLTPQDFTGMDVSNAFEAGAWWADVTLQEKNAAPCKPLTDAQIGAVAADIWGSVLIAPQSYQAFARAIEAAHGIKGDA